MTKNANEGEKPKVLMGSAQRTNLNSFQEAHLRGEINVYKPIEAYAEEWVHEEDKDGNFIRAYPKPGTRRRSDLPSLCEQWRDNIQRKNKHEQGTRRGRYSRPRNRQKLS